MWAGCVSFFSVIGRGCTLTDSVSTDMLFIVSTKQKRKDTFVLPLNDCVRYETLQANITDCTELKQSKHTFRSYCNVALQTEVLFCTMGCLMSLDLVQGKNEDSRPIIKGFGFYKELYYNSDCFSWADTQNRNQVVGNFIFIIFTTMIINDSKLYL